MQIPGRTVAVIGGGVAGLSAGHTLRRAGCDVTVLEASPRLGGRLSTAEVAGEMVELGMKTELDRVHQRSLIVTGPEIRSIWPISELITAGALSIPALAGVTKGVMALLPRWNRLDPANLMLDAKDDTESIGAWSRRLVGKEGSERFIEPIINGVFYGDSAKISRVVLFSMLKAALTGRRTFRLRGGMVSFVDALAAGLDVRCGVTVGRVVRTQADWRVEYRVPGGGWRTTVFDAVVCAVPANRVSKIVADLGEHQRGFFDGVEYTCTAVGLFETPPESPTFSGPVVFSTDEETFFASIGPHVPRGGLPRRSNIVKMYLSSEAFTKHADLPDGDLLKLMLLRAKESKALRGSLENGRAVRLQRWPTAVPSFYVGHVKRLAAGEFRRPGQRGLSFAGDYLRGPYIEGAVSSGVAAARELLSYFSAE